MKKYIILSVVLFSGFAFGSGATDISCSFPTENLSISIKDFKASSKIGESGLLDLSYAKNGQSKAKALSSPVGMARGSWVANDLSDQRPTALLNFEDEGVSERIAIYYCSGNGEVVEAKFFRGQIDKQKNSSFNATLSASGTCTGKKLTATLTNDCASFK